jgi:transposase
VRVVLEATGIYSLDVSLALAAAGHAVMVANPRAVRHYAEACLRRGKNDRADAKLLADYACRMPFEPWQPPSAQALALRSLARQRSALTDDLTVARNRLHAAQATQSTHPTVIATLNGVINALEDGIKTLEREAAQLVASDEELERRSQLLTTIPGVAARSAQAILAELVAVSGDMDHRQLVAYAGIDVLNETSGSSVAKRPRISRRGNPALRRALYMPALVAIRRDPHFRRFFDRLVARGLKKLQAIVAVMRKMLHAVSAILRTASQFDGAKLFPA